MALLARSGSTSARAMLASLSMFPRAMRGYAASAASGAMRRAAEGTAAVVEAKEAGRRGAVAEAASWVPDPVTGHYRPANLNLAAADPADLRAAHLTRA